MSPAPKSASSNLSIHRGHSRTWWPSKPRLVCARQKVDIQLRELPLGSGAKPGIQHYTPLSRFSCHSLRERAYYIGSSFIGPSLCGKCFHHLAPPKSHQTKIGTKVLQTQEIFRGKPHNYRTSSTRTAGYLICGGKGLA